MRRNCTSNFDFYMRIAAYSWSQRCFIVSANLSNLTVQKCQRQQLVAKCKNEAPSFITINIISHSPLSPCIYVFLLVVLPFIMLPAIQSLLVVASIITACSAIPSFHSSSFQAFNHDLRRRAPSNSSWDRYGTTGSDLSTQPWKPAMPLASRSPCPLLNTFSNHGIL